jgi:hypothetical protein
MNRSAVELVYFKGCPNADTARDHIRRALVQAGRPERWTEWDLEDEATPERYKSHGSPTVLVDGRDVADSPQSAVGLSCNADGAPSVDRIAEALTS